MRLPGWLVFVIFVPLQIWIFLMMKDIWGWGWTFLTFLIIGLVATRAGRAGFLREAFFPRRAERWERNRFVFQGILLLGAVVTFALPWGPQPWLPAAAAASLVKSAVR